MDEKRLQHELSATNLRYNMKSIREFARVIVRSVKALQANEPDYHTVSVVLDALAFCLQRGTVGGRPVLDTDLGPLHTGRFLAAGSYNRVRRGTLSGESVIVRTTLRNPNTGSKSVLIFAIEAAIHALLSGEEGVPRFVCPIKTVRPDGGTDVGTVSEYIEGASLIDVLKSSTTTDELFCDLLIKVMDILHRLWERYGFRHRDLRGDNIMVRPDMSVVLIDFGFAHMAAFGLDCNADCTFVDDSFPNCIDVVMLLWTILDDCPNLYRDAPLTTEHIMGLLRKHNDLLYERYPRYNTMDKDIKWYCYQRHFVYEIGDDEDLTPGNVAESFRQLHVQCQ